jgi:hypothetical protein
VPIIESDSENEGPDVRERIAAEILILLQLYLKGFLLQDKYYGPPQIF